MADENKSAKEEQALQKALSPIVNRLIDDNFENAGDKIATQMAPLIGGAIREQIKSQKDDVVDALYPVMGNMISKFVTKSLEELLSKINAQIQEGLSVTTIKRKIKAKLKGVSETELLLEENAEAEIKAVLLIHKESGALLCKVEREEANLSDADMLASMMSAIRSFVNEWVEANAPYHELGEIEFGGNKIVLEASGYSYLAVIVEGAVYTKTYEKIRHVLESIVYEYGEKIQHFNGSFEDFPQEQIAQKLKPLLEHKNPQKEEKKKIHPLLILLPLLLVGWLAYSSYEEYKEHQLQQAVEQKLSSVPALALFNIKTSVNDNNVTVDAKVPFPYYKELIEKTVLSVPGVAALNNKTVVIPTLTDPMQTSANIGYMLKGFNLSHKSNIAYRYNYKNLTLFGNIYDKKAKEKLVAQLKAIPGIEHIEDKTELITPKINTKIYFEKAKSQLSDADKKKLYDIALKLKKVPQRSVELFAYSDLIGSKKRNEQLAQKRIENIVQYLRNIYGVTNAFEPHIFHQAPPGVDAKVDPDRARCVVINLKPKEEK